MTRARDLADSADKDIAGTLTVDDLTASGDVSVAGNLSVSGTTVTIDSANAQTVDLGDNDKIRMGDDDDLQIYHDGSNSRIADQGTGGLILQGDAGVYVKSSDNAETMAQFVKDGEVSLWYNNVSKFETTATGVDVTGTITADGLTVEGTAFSGMNIQAGASSVAAIDFGDAADTNIGGINYNNADDTLNLRSGNLNRLTINSSGSVGIGVNDADANLDISGGSNKLGILRVTQRASGAAAYGLDVGLDPSTGDPVFSTIVNDTVTEAMRIQRSSGNLLVGTAAVGVGTSSSDTGIVARGSIGFLEVARDGGNPVRLNRQSSDGSIIDFAKDGSTVGSIGSFLGDVYIQGPSGHSGIQFNTNGIIPLRDGSILDNALDLGHTNYRYKDLYLSGGVVFDAVAGNATSNTLDDSEEGTWTPTAAQGASGLNHEAANCIYTKIGRQVTLQFEITNLISPNGSTFNLGGIPFNAVQEGSGSVMYNNVDIPGSRSQIVIYNSSSSYLRFYALGDNTTWYALIGTNLGTSFNMIGQITYQTAT